MSNRRVTYRIAQLLGIVAGVTGSRAAAGARAGDTRPAFSERRGALTQQEVRAIAAAYSSPAGCSLAVLAGSYRRSSRTIAAALREAGVEVRPRGRTLSAARSVRASAPGRPGPQPRPLPSPEALVRGYEQAGSLRALARQLGGASERRLRAALADAGLDAGRCRKADPAVQQRIRDLSSGGMRPGEIAQLSDVSLATVRRLIQRA